MTAWDSASPTLASLVAVDDATTLPVLRPLIGWEKQEITDARSIGTADISVLPDEDCCSLLGPRQVRYCGPGRTKRYRSLLEAVQEEEHHHPMSTAVRHLLVIGVGCGAPDHLTFAAARAMHRADVLSVLSKGRGKSALLRLRPDGTDS